MHDMEHKWWLLELVLAGKAKHHKLHYRVVLIMNTSVFLRPILQKDLTVRSSQTGTIADIEAALKLSADGTIVNHIEVFSLDKLNCALDRLKAGEVLGKLVIDLRSSDANGSEEPVPKRRRVNGTR